MLVKTPEGVEQTIGLEELTVLRRNVALGYSKQLHKKPDGEIEIKRNRRPHWAGFQQRLVWPGETEFIRKNPMGDDELRQAAARMLKNLKRTEEPVKWSHFTAYTKKRPYKLTERKRQLRDCEEKAFELNDKLQFGYKYMILAFVDLLVLCWELDPLIWAAECGIQDPAPLAGREAAAIDLFRP